MAIAVLTEALVYAGFFSIYRQTARKQYYKQTGQAISLLSDSIRRNIAELEQGIVYKVWGSSIFRSDYDIFQDDLYMYQRNLQKLASMFQMSRIPLKAIYSCDRQGHEAYYSVSNEDIDSLDDYLETEIADYMRQNKETITNRYGGTWFRRCKDYPDSVYVIKNVIDTSSTNYLGVTWRFLSGANGKLFSAVLPPAACRIGAYGRLLAGIQQAVSGASLPVLIG